jgi:hypothetical protein
MRLEIRLGARNEEGTREMQAIQASEVDMAPIHDMIAPASGVSKSSACTSCNLPSETWMKLGMLPRKSSSVCILTAALAFRKCAHENTDRQRSMVVESRAYSVLDDSSLKSSLA